MFRTFFTVVGELSFPVDMLRYDSAHPQTQEDVNAITDSLDPDARSDRRVCSICHTPLRDHSAGHFDHQPERKVIPFRVKLIAYHSNKTMPFTPERWASFGWSVAADPRPLTEKVR